MNKHYNYSINIICYFPLWKYIQQVYINYYYIGKQIYDKSSSGNSLKVNLV